MLFGKRQEATPVMQTGEIIDQYESPQCFVGLPKFELKIELLCFCPFALGSVLNRKEDHLHVVKVAV
jgi:hypothetical protein